MPVALPVALAATAAATVGGAVISSSAAKKASKTAANAATTAATENNALQRDIYDQNKATLSPFVNAGSSVTPTIQSALGLNGSTAANDAFNLFKGSSGYNFRLAEGQKSVTSALGSRGYLDSGAAQKSLLKYGQGAASNEFGNWLQALTGQQSMGLSAASAQAGVGQGYANSVSANNNNAANATGNAALSNANATGQIVNGALSSFGQLAGLASSYGSKPAMTLPPAIGM
jgi:hypothetical protein